MLSEWLTIMKLDIVNHYQRFDIIEKISSQSRMPITGHRLYVGNKSPDKYGKLKLLLEGAIHF